MIIFHHFAQPRITRQHCFVAFCSAVVIPCNVLYFRLYSKITMLKLMVQMLHPPEDHAVQHRVITIQEDSV